MAATFDHISDRVIVGMTQRTPDRRGDWMQTYQGRQFWPLDPRAEDVHIVDIAHSLSMQCRYGGHSLRFYSVAEHCFHVSRIVAPEFAKWGLLHDAAEAYASDVIRPLKPYLTNYATIEARLMSVICDRFNLDAVEPAAVKAADKQICVDEMEQIMRDPPAPWDTSHLVAAGVNLPCWGPSEAKDRFLSRFAELFPVEYWK